MPEAARIALHREAGRELARSGAPLSQVASLVLLGAVTGDAEAALSLRGAARDAAARAPGIAVALLPRADELLPPDHPERDGVLLELVVALLRTGQVAQAAKITEDVLARPHDADVDLPLRIAMIDALSILNRGQELIDLTESTLTENPDMPLADQALIMAQGSFGKTFSGDYAGGELTARRALALAERAGDPAMIVWSMTTMAVAVKTQGRYEEALDLTRTAVRLAFDGANDSARMRHPNFIHGMVLCDCDLMDDATVAFRKAATESVELESAWIVPDLHLVVAELRFLLGDWAEAEPEFEGGLTAARERGNLILMLRIHAYLALVAAARGDVRAAELALEPVQANSRAPDRASERSSSPTRRR
jgi:tetratricopeptide (TPR) repeat protein